MQEAEPSKLSNSSVVFKSMRLAGVLAALAHAPAVARVPVSLPAAKTAAGQVAKQVGPARLTRSMSCSAS